MQRNKHFLYLLLTTTRQQARSLLQTITDQQIDVLGEIFYNLLRLDLTKSQETFLKQKKTLAKKLSDKKASQKVKARFITEHSLSVLRLLLKFKSKLLQLLK